MGKHSEEGFDKDNFTSIKSNVVSLFRLLSNDKDRTDYTLSFSEQGFYLNNKNNPEKNQCRSLSYVEANVILQSLRNSFRLYSSTKNKETQAFIPSSQRPTEFNDAFSTSESYLPAFDIMYRSNFDINRAHSPELDLIVFKVHEDDKNIKPFNDEQYAKSKKNGLTFIAGDRNNIFGLMRSIALKETRQGIRVNYVSDNTIPLIEHEPRILSFISEHKYYPHKIHAVSSMTDKSVIIVDRIDDSETMDAIVTANLSGFRVYAGIAASGSIDDDHESENINRFSSRCNRLIRAYGLDNSYRLDEKRPYIILDADALTTE